MLLAASDVTIDNRQHRVLFAEGSKPIGKCNVNMTEQIDIDFNVQCQSLVLCNLWYS